MFLMIDSQTTAKKAGSAFKTRHHAQSTKMRLNYGLWMIMLYAKIETCRKALIIPVFLPKNKKTPKVINEKNQIS